MNNANFNEMDNGLNFLWIVNTRPPPPIQNIKYGSCSVDQKVIFSMSLRAESTSYS